jgi:hypothetical protein
VTIFSQHFSGHLTEHDCKKHINQPFEVTFINDEAFPILHEFVVLKLPAGKTAQDVVNDARKKGPKAEDDWVHAADSGAALPVGASALVRMDLPPGNYVATCWQTGKAGGGNGPPHGLFKELQTRAPAAGFPEIGLFERNQIVDGRHERELLVQHD